MLFRDLIVRGNAHPWSIYLLMSLSRASVLSTDWDDLWFTLSIIMSKSDFLVFDRVEILVSKSVGVIIQEKHR